ncbi:Mediator of RNA polymerase II transcription subunit 25, partial [Mucuna pruriens]
MVKELTIKAGVKGLDFWWDKEPLGVNPSCEVGLIMYNTKSELGLNIHYINWTTDVDYFLRTLWRLAFNGDNLNQQTVVEGLAGALVMFPRPSSRMTMQEYYQGERQCILVATGDPIAMRMQVALPKVEGGKFVEGQFKHLNANFLEVAKTFVPSSINYTMSMLLHAARGEPLNNYSKPESNGNSLMADTPMNIDHGIEDLFSASSMTIGQQSTVGVQNVGLESASTLSPAIPQATTNEIYVPSSSCSMPMNIGYDDFLAELCNDSDIFLPQSITTDTTSTIHLAPNSSEEVNISITPELVVSDATIFTAGEGSSSRGLGQELGSNLGVVNPITTTTTNSLTQFQAPSFPVLSHGSSSSSHQQIPSGQPAMGASTWVSPVPMMPQYFSPRPPSLMDIQDFVDAWEGCLAGKIHSNPISFNQVKALRRPTSPVTLTAQWSKRLEIVLFIPQKAVNHTIKICDVPIDYVFFYISQFNNDDLFDHLMSRNLCAKIALPTQTLILSTTESKNHYLGTIFAGDTDH